MDIKILDTKIDILSKQQVLDKIKNLLESDESGKQLCTTNPEFILATQKDKEFKKIINNSWLSVADGYGVRLAAKYLYKKNIQVITGTDLIPEICKLNAKIFLLGGYNNTPKLAAENLKKQNPNLQIDYSVFEVNDVISKINETKADILFVALNHPRAQKWINKNLSKMPSVKLAIGVGGAFDYISGKIKRAPKFWRSCGLEWLYRLIHHPKRLGRIWQATVVFTWKVFVNDLKN